MDIVKIIAEWLFALVPIGWVMFVFLKLDANRLMAASITMVVGPILWWPVMAIITPGWGVPQPVEEVSKVLLVTGITLLLTFLPRWLRQEDERRRRSRHDR